MRCASQLLDRGTAVMLPTRPTDRAAGHGRHRQDPGRDGVRAPVPERVRRGLVGHRRSGRPSSTARSSTSAPQLGIPAMATAPETMRGAALARPWRAPAALAADLRQRREQRQGRGIPPEGQRRPRDDHVPRPQLGRPCPADPGRRLRTQREHRPPVPAGADQCAGTRRTGSPTHWATCRSRSPPPVPGWPTPAPLCRSICASFRPARTGHGLAQLTWDLSLERLETDQPRRTGCCSCARCWPPRSRSIWSTATRWPWR